MVLSAPTWSRSWLVWRRRPYEVLAQAGRQAAEAGADHRKSTPDPAEFSAKTDIDGLPKLWCATDLKPAAQPSWLTKDRIPRTRRHPPSRRRRDRQEPAVGRVVAAVTIGKALPEFGIPARKPSPVTIVLTEDGWQDMIGRELVNGPSRAAEGPSCRPSSRASLPSQSR